MVRRRYRGAASTSHSRIVRPQPVRRGGGTSMLFPFRRWPPEASGLDVAPAFERPSERQLVGVLEVATHRQATRQPRGLEPEWLQQPAEVHGRGLALDVRVRAE